MHEDDKIHSRAKNAWDNHDWFFSGLRNEVLDIRRMYQEVLTLVLDPKQSSPFLSQISRTEDSLTGLKFQVYRSYVEVCEQVVLTFVPDMLGLSVSTPSPIVTSVTFGEDAPDSLKIKMVSDLLEVETQRRGLVHPSELKKAHDGIYHWFMFERPADNACRRMSEPENMREWEQGLDVLWEMTHEPIESYNKLWTHVLQDLMFYVMRHDRKWAEAYFRRTKWDLFFNGSGRESLNFNLYEITPTTYSNLILSCHSREDEKAVSQVFYSSLPFPETLDFIEESLGYRLDLDLSGSLTLTSDDMSGALTLQDPSEDKKGWLSRVFGGSDRVK